MTALAQIRCEPLPMPERPPAISIPHLGILEKAWEGLHSIPDPGQLLCKFQDAAAAAMAPIRRYLEMVETVAAFYNCMNAIPKAISQMSPDPVFDCLRDLAKAIARILSWFPPMSYVRTGVDLADYAISVIDEIVALFVELDSLIADYEAVLSEANLLGDTELVDITNCGMMDVKIRLVIALDLMGPIKPLTDMLMDPFIRLMPNPELVKQLKKIKDSYDESDTFIRQAGVSMRGNQALPPFKGYEGEAAQPNNFGLPPMGAVLQAINQTRNALAMLYNVLAPLVGDDPDMEMVDLPELQYL